MLPQVHGLGAPGQEVIRHRISLAGPGLLVEAAEQGGVAFGDAMDDAAFGEALGAEQLPELGQLHQGQGVLQLGGAELPAVGLHHMEVGEKAPPAVEVQVALHRFLHHPQGLLFGPDGGLIGEDGEQGVQQGLVEL